MTQPAITIKDLAVQVELSAYSVHHHIETLKADGKFRHIGPTKAGWWEVLEDRDED